MPSPRTRPPIAKKRSDQPSFVVPRTEAERHALKRAVIAGECERADRGLYLVNPSAFSAYHELAAIAVRKPNAVICLESAAIFHGLTSTPPLKNQFGISRSSHAPRWGWPAYEAITLDLDRKIGGIDEHVLEGIPVKITCPARTVAECLKHYRIVSQNSFQEILWSAWRMKKANVQALRTFGRHFGVERDLSLMLSTIMGP